MKAAVYYENGGPEVFRYEDVPDPVYKPTEILIQIKSISIEGGDLINREMRPLFHVPNIVGYQCAGEIIAVGNLVKDRLIGQRVVTVVPFGSHAEQIATESFRTFIIPEQLTWQQAAAIPVAFLTAHECLFTLGGLKEGESVLIHGGTGAVGIAAIQMAKEVNAHIIATGSDPSKLKFLALIGANQVINYKTEDFNQVIYRAFEGKGVNLIIDSVGGGAHLAKSTESLAYRGRLVYVGRSSRDQSLFDPQALWKKNTSIQGVYLPGVMENEPERISAVLDKIFAKVIDDQYQVVIAETFPLSQVKEAYEFITDKKGFGRVMLTP